MKVVERTFLSNEKYEELKQYFTEQNKIEKIENQIIYNYKSDTDFRMIQTKDYIKLDMRKEQEHYKVMIHPSYRQHLEKMFYHLGMSITVKRYRKRAIISSDDGMITLDKSLKFGNVLRIELEAEKKEGQAIIQSFYDKFEIEPTSLDDFNIRLSKYKMTSLDLMKEAEENAFLQE